MIDAGWLPGTGRAAKRTRPSAVRASPEPAVISPSSSSRLGAPKLSLKST